VSGAGSLVGLANRYRVMRHGQSKANAAGVIVSSIEADRGGDYGLTAAGREQALAAARASGLGAGTVICASDFARATQTARIVAGCVGADGVTLAPELRERYFGVLDGAPAAGYQRVWAADEAAADPVPGVEPAAAVLERATALVTALEERYTGRDVLLVSHGDTLQILLAGFAGLDPARHRRLPPLGTAEIRPALPGG
jgi:probable phosphoglycerate mutase